MLQFSASESIQEAGKSLLKHAECMFNDKTGLLVTNVEPSLCVRCQPVTSDRSYQKWFTSVPYKFRHMKRVIIFNNINLMFTSTLIKHIKSMYTEKNTFKIKKPSLNIGFLRYIKI